jgi:hypothetical protein
MTRSRKPSQPFEPDPPFDIPEREPPKSVLDFREKLKARFPEDAARATANTEQYWGCPWEEITDHGCGVWFEKFGAQTAAAMRRRDEETVLAHLQCISERLQTADKQLADAIDVSYMENLFYKLDKRSQRWGWLRIPQNLKDLYIQFWGVIGPSRIEALERNRRRKKAP